MKALANLFLQSESDWERHTSGWSVWTRVATGPLLPLAVLSHVWIGWIPALTLTVLLSVWLAINPRLFPPPASTRAWHSRAVLGERVWLNRAEVPIPRHHAIAAMLLSIVSGIGAATALLAAILGWVWPALLGTGIMMLGKLWFCHRMVRLYDDMYESVPEYRAWLY